MVLSSKLLLESTSGLRLFYQSANSSCKRVQFGNTFHEELLTHSHLEHASRAGVREGGGRRQGVLPKSLRAHSHLERASVEGVGGVCSHATVL